MKKLSLQEVKLQILKVFLLLYVWIILGNFLEMLDYLSSIGKTSRDEIFQGFWRPNFLGCNVTILSTHLLPFLDITLWVKLPKKLTWKREIKKFIFQLSNRAIKSPFEFKLSHKLLGCQKYFSCKWTRLS